MLTAWSLGPLMASNRKQTANVCGLLLHVRVTHEASTGRVTFDRVEYTPTYIWSAKANGETFYRTLVSDFDPPIEMDQKQITNMATALAHVDKVMKDAAAQLRVLGD